MKSWDSPYQCVSVVNKEKIIWTPGLLNIILLHFVICFVASSCLFLSTSIAEGCHDIDQLPYMREDGCFYVEFICKLTTNLFFLDLSHWQLKGIMKTYLLFCSHFTSKVNNTKAEVVGSTPYFLRAVAALAAPGVGGVATLPPAVWRCVEGGARVPRP